MLSVHKCFKTLLGAPRMVLLNSSKSDGHDLAETTWFGRPEGLRTTRVFSFSDRFRSNPIK